MPAAQLLGPVQVDHTSLAVGESIRIDATRPDATPWNGEEDCVITINGVRGSTQYLQFPAPGKRTISVLASKDDTSEHREVTLTVTGDRVGDVAPPSPGQQMLMSQRLSLVPALLHLQRTERSPYRVAISVGARPSDDRGLLDAPVQPPRNDTSKELPVWAKESMTRLVTTSVFADQLADLEPAHVDLFRARKLNYRGAATSFRGELTRIDDQVVLPAMPAPVAWPTYYWDLGDGTTMTTTTPMVEHDYQDSLSPDRDHQQFHVTARLEVPGEEPIEVRRTVTVFSGYVLAKQHGVIVPKVTVEGDAHKVVNGFEASFAVKNIEPFDLTLDTLRVEQIAEDSNAQTVPGAGIGIDPPITIAANQTSVVPVRVDFGQVPAGCPGFVVYYGGTTPDGVPVRVEAHFDVAVRDHISTGVLLRDVAITHLDRVRSALAEAQRVVEPPLEQDAAVEGRIFKMGRATKSITLSQTVHGFNQMRSDTAVLSQVLLTPKTEVQALIESNAHVETVMQRLGIRESIIDLVTAAADPVENVECDPDNIPDGLAEEWVCQATTEKRVIPMPGRFMNARKGDVILSPGGNGKIGGLLRQVSPPQLYSHSGIMTRNRDAITHSTASEDRLQAYPVGTNPIDGTPAATDGFRPDIVKYGWPGVITQTVDGAIWGDQMADPEHPENSYRISSFSPYRGQMEVDGQWEIVPPLVVKPDPMQETPEIRAKLHQIANFALGEVGKSHYRFFCYTDPSIGLTDTAPPSAGWASATYPSVCSSFIWMCLKKNGVQLESGTEPIPDADIEAKDRMAGAMVNAATRDGLYLYTAKERKQAAQWLYDSIYEDAMKKSGVLGRLLTDAPDDVCNQFLNTFASDWSDGDSKNSDKWKETSDANAVSPDNILLWDAPDLNSLHGFVAPADYREARYEEITVHKWGKVFQHGDVSGTVRKEGNPVAGALVQLQDGLSDFTDGAGRYRIAHVAVGPWEASASLDTQDGQYRSGKVPFTVSGGSITVDIDLAPPAEDFRLLRITGGVKIHDSESFGDDEDSGVFPVFKDMHLQPWSTHDDFTWVQGWGGEMRIELGIRGDLHVGRGVRVSVDYRLFEGASEETSDLDGTYHRDDDLPPDTWRTFGLRLANDDEGGDWAQIDLKFENVVNPV